MKNLAEIQLTYEYLHELLRLPSDVKIRAIEQTVEDRLYQTMLIVVEGNRCRLVNEGARPVRVDLVELQNEHQRA